MTPAQSLSEPEPVTGAARQAVVVGLGRTGVSCVRFLLRSGYSVRAVDSRIAPPLLDAVRAEFPELPVTLGPFTADGLATHGPLVVSPGVAVSDPAITAAGGFGAQVMGDIELFARARQAPVAAITGSNGKSTVTALVGEMCREAGRCVGVGGNIGVPALDLLEQEPQADCFVLELSSFQLETTDSLRPEVAAILNISMDHMDRYADLDQYFAAKARILEGARSAVLNRDDWLLGPLMARVPDTLSFGLSAPANERDLGLLEIDGAVWLARGREPLLRASELPLVGRHNLANVLAAFAIGGLLGLPGDRMQAAARRFRGLPHRAELVAERDGVRWVNDSKATNVGAAVAAIEGVAAPVILIAGGDGKGADFSSLRGPVERAVRAVVLIGRDAPLLAGALGRKVPVQHAGSMAQAVAMAGSLARSGDVVLLSPACASFDMYGGFEERGEDFKRAVRDQLG